MPMSTLLRPAGSFGSTTQDLSSLDHPKSLSKNDGASGQSLPGLLGMNGRLQSPAHDARDEEESSARTGEKMRAGGEDDGEKMRAGGEDDVDRKVKKAANKKKTASNSPQNSIGGDQISDKVNGMISRTMPSLNSIGEDEIVDKSDDMIGRTISVESANAEQNPSAGNKVGGGDAATLASMSIYEAAATHHLLEQQTYLENAPEDVREEYYGALSRVAILNMKAEGEKAELELKKIELETDRLWREKLKVGAESRCIEAMSCGGCLLDEFSDYFNELMGNPPDEDETASHASSTVATRTTKGESTVATRATKRGESTLVTRTNDKQRRDDESTLDGSEYSKKVKVAVAGLNQAHRERKAVFEQIESKKEEARRAWAEAERLANSKKLEEANVDGLRSAQPIAEESSVDTDRTETDAARAKLKQVEREMKRALSEAARTEAGVVEAQEGLQRALEELGILKQTINTMGADIARAEEEQKRVEAEMTRGAAGVKAMQEELQRAIEEMETT